MTTGIKYCFENDDVKKAAQVMEDNHIRRVMVMNKDKRIAGIVSLGDMATNGHDRKLSAEVLERVSEHMPA
jgi:predicted transcriptional regulator